MNNLSKRIISSVIFLPLSLYLISSGSIELIFFTIICLIVSCYEWFMITKNKFDKILGFVFLIISFFTFYIISSDFIVFLFIICVCVSTDIGGYVFGKFFKGPKLTKISPNKTYSGMVGGFFLSLISLGIFLNMTDYLDIMKELFILTILISTVSQLGDIIISFYKRKSNLKNTGNILPGHGGLLDRIDGMIFVFPVFYLIDLMDFLSL